MAVVPLPLCQDGPLLTVGAPNDYSMFDQMSPVAGYVTVPQVYKTRLLEVQVRELAQLPVSWHSKH